MKKNAITLGQIGILIPIASIFLGPFASLASIVLLIISYNYFTKHYNEPKIFTNYLVGFLVSVGSTIIGIVLLIYAFGSSMQNIMNDLKYTNPDFDSLLRSMSFVKIIAALIIFYIGYIVSNYLQYVAKKELTVKTQVKEYETSGLLNLIGSICIILIGLGFIVMFIGWIFEIVAFFNTKDDVQEFLETKEN